jgi:thiopurine S-methyltransferase
MHADFWLRKWAVKDIAFHQAEANPLLLKWFKKLSLEQGSRVFLPLCGKTLDIAWLLSNGYHVAGAELSEVAIEELFLELGMKPEVTEVGKLKHYAGENIDIFVGDIFNLSAPILGRIDAIYDRAALVALPEDMRRQYSSHLMKITGRARQFTIVFEYDQTLLAGPPFSIDATEVSLLYSDVYRLQAIESVDVAGGLKGICAAKENAWLLSNSDHPV